MCTFCSCKCGFVFFNLLFLASGVVLLTIGIRQQSTYTDMGAFAGNSLAKIAIVLIAVGATITLVAIVGLLGAFLNNYNLVTTFICCLIIIIIFEILTGGVIYVFRNKLKDLSPDENLKDSTLKIVKGSMDYAGKARKVISEYSPEKRVTIDRIQEKLKCCGADGPADWATSVGWVEHEAVPDSCCVVKDQGCGKDKEKVRSKGCLKAINLFLAKSLLWVGAFCIVLGISEGFGVLIGICFCLTIKNKNYENMS